MVLSEQEMLNHPLLKGKFYMAVGYSEGDDVAVEERLIRRVMRPHRTDIDFSIPEHIRRKYKTAQDQIDFHNRLQEKKEENRSRDNKILSAYSEMVARVYNVPLDLVTGKARVGDACLARYHMVHVVMNNHPDIKVSTVGRFLKKDHTSVLYGLRKISRSKELIKPFMKRVDEEAEKIRERFTEKEVVT